MYHCHTLLFVGCGLIFKGVDILPNLEYKLDFALDTDNISGNIPVIIVAAGSSIRMQGISKQFVSLCGVPAIVHTLSAFENSPQISRIILVTKEEFINEIQILADKFMIHKLTDIVSGGNTRQESVICGLNRLGEEEYVLIHDGARPLISSAVISRVCDALPSADGVIPTVKVKDTIKSVDEKGMVIKTVPRDLLYSVQTPQGVNVKKYREAINSADISAFTDDASILESAGMSVKIVEGDYKNIKITTPDDIGVAEFYLEKGENDNANR